MALHCATGEGEEAVRDGHVSFCVRYSVSTSLTGWFDIEIDMCFACAFCVPISLMHGLSHNICHSLSVYAICA